MPAPHPNILIVIADQMAAPALPVYGHPVVRAPHIERLADGGVVFENAYCNAPICAPSRYSMLSGQLPSRIGVYDNASEFPSSVATITHFLRLAGYRTCAAGKMHFVGTDQQHGFEERLTTDIYPADFGWTPNWRRPAERLEWFHNLINVVAAGPLERSLQIDFDDEVAFRSQRWLYDYARGDDKRPFFLLVSFSHPHDPYNIPRDYWDRYPHDAIDLPVVPPIPLEERDPHSRRLFENYGGDELDITEDHVRSARHAYYGAISYVDDQIGKLLQVLEETRQSENTMVIVTSDHGDMLGERGMWYKMNFFEWASRVPLIFHAPARIAPARRTENVSLVDLFPTLLDVAGKGFPQPSPIDGHSLAPMLDGGDVDRPHAVLAEYLAEGCVAPVLMVRQGTYKYVECPADPPQLYDLESDPEELTNLAGRPEHAATQQQLADLCRGAWDIDALTRDIVASQDRRRLIFQALMTGERTLWDFEPRHAEARAYVRNIAGLYEKEARAFLPPRGK